jgi:hypothetical protein
VSEGTECERMSTGGDEGNEPVSRPPPPTGTADDVASACITRFTVINCSVVSTFPIHTSTATRTHSGDMREGWW